MPKPRKGESKSSYMGRCVTQVTGEGKKRKQAIAMCLSMWNQAKKKQVSNMEYITLNISLDTAHFKEETLHGEEYYVVPVAMMVPGVHDGSQGELFYPDEELKNATPSWNHKPICVNHPQKGTACTQSFLEAHQVGMLMDTLFDGKQRAAAWVSKRLAKKRDSRIVEAIKNKQPMEVSTGLFVDKVEDPGTFEGKPYKFVAVNHRPDHLAILPDKIGACSVSKGAGLNVLNEDERASFKKEVAQEVVSKLKSHFKGDGTMAKSKKELVDGLITNENSKWEEKDRKRLEGLSEETLELLSETLEPDKKLSFNTQEELDAEVEKRVKERIEKPDFIKELRKQRFEELVGNDGEDKKKGEKKGDKDPPKQQTVEEFLASAPAEIRRVVLNGMNIEKQEKERFIGIITTNKSNKFTKEFLQTLDLGTLQGMAALVTPADGADPASPPAYNYYGSAGVPPQMTQITEEGMPTPVYNDKMFGSGLEFSGKSK